MGIGNLIQNFPNKKNKVESNDFDVTEMVKGAISPYEKFCDGFGSPGASGNNYILGLMLGAGYTKIGLRHDGSQLLDEINAFDRAEVSRTYIGQINMSIVSSFCGPAGVIWGYDIAKVNNLRQEHELGVEAVGEGKNLIPVYSARPLMEATTKLFGTVVDRRYNLIPGGHIPCAGKSFKESGPRHIYAAIAVGIARDRVNNANLLMEDLGWLPLRQDSRSLRKYKKLILQNIAQSVVEVGKNQRVEYKEIYLEMIDIVIAEGHLGCALVAAPYFTLAKNAIPEGDPANLARITLSQWDKMVK